MESDLELLRRLQDITRSTTYIYKNGDLAQAELDDRLPNLCAKDYVKAFVNSHECQRRMWPTGNDMITVWLTPPGHEFLKKGEPPASRKKRSPAPDPTPTVITNYDPMARPGQRDFHDKLIEIYGPQCAVTGTMPPETLQAAHIQSFSICQSFHCDNGLILRADIHCLFDADLIGFEPIDPADPASKLRVIVAKAIRVPPYHDYHEEEAQFKGETYKNPNRDLLSDQLKRVMGSEAQWNEKLR